MNNTYCIEKLKQEVFRRTHNEYIHLNILGIAEQKGCSTK